MGPDRKTGPVMFRHMTVAKNIAYGLRVRPRRERRVRSTAEPRVLLLDEPFGALAAEVRRDLRRWLREVHDRTGHTTPFVTHDQEEALELAALYVAG